MRSNNIDPIFENELSEADLRSHLSIVCDWFRIRMRSHVDPPDNETTLIQSERDVSDMIEAYLGKLVHYVFPISEPAIEPHNTSLLDREKSLAHSKEQRSKRRFNLGESNKLFDDAFGGDLKPIRKEFQQWLAPGQVQKPFPRAAWVGFHLWLERRIATGFRLLFLEGQNWRPQDAAWDISRVVHDWPNTLTRSIFQYGRPGTVPPSQAKNASQLCTAICAFDSEQEKISFENTSGLKDGEYVYLWSGEPGSSLSDFSDGVLVWFNDTDEKTTRSGLPEEPKQTIGRQDVVQKRWNLFRKELEESFSTRGSDHFLKLRQEFRSQVRSDTDPLLEDSPAIRRNLSALQQILDKPGYSAEDCFWALQSVMFYDWKYWYLFPFTYEAEHRGGLAFSSTQPLSSEQLRLLALFTWTILQLFAETEDWARNRLRERRQENLRQATDRVHAEWLRRATEGVSLRDDHQDVFEQILETSIFNPSDGQHSYPKRFAPNSEQGRLLARTWNEQQKGNVVFAVVNYWNEATQTQGRRVFAPWLSPHLGNNRYDNWKSNWDRYKALTESARELSPPYFTLNDFLFDQAPFKSMLEWVGYDWQPFPRSQDSPVDWVLEPPSITPEVRDVLFKPLEDIETYSAEVYTTLLRTVICSLRSNLRKQLEHYEDRLTKFVNTKEKLPELGLFKGDLASLRNTLTSLRIEVDALHEAIPNVSSSEDITAEYLIRLAIYLNTRMNNGDRPSFLGVARCAFLTWALYQHYGPNAFVFDDSQGSINNSAKRGRWHFYSIPIHIPLPNQEGIQRTSILSLGTIGRVTDEELRLWREIGTEIVLPAMMLDQRQEITVREGQRLRAGMAVGLYHQLGQVLTSATATLQTVLDQGQRFYVTLRNFTPSNGPMDDVTALALKSWTRAEHLATKRMKRLQMFREFAFGQLTGALRKGEFKSGRLITYDALEIAKEYSVGSTVVDQIRIDVSKRLDDLLLNEDAYGFILQEILANACRYATGNPPRIVVDSMQEGDRQLIEVRNSISKDQFNIFQVHPLDVRSEPGPEKQSGRGLFGVYCLFQARRIPNAPDPHSFRNDEGFWLALRIPVIDFSKGVASNV